MSEILELDKSGVYVLKNFFSVEEVTEIISNYTETINSKNNFINKNYGYVYPGLFRNKNININLLRIEILEKKLSRYFDFEINVTKHSDLHIDTYGTWHNDCGPNNSYLPENYYLQNKKSDIFKIAIIENLNNLNATSFKINKRIYTPKLKTGDVLIFRIELLHSAPSLNLLEKLIISIQMKFGLKKLITDKFKRRAIFFTAGKKGNILNYFLDRNMEREDNQKLN